MELPPEEAGRFRVFAVEWERKQVGWGPAQAAAVELRGVPRRAQAGPCVGELMPVGEHSTAAGLLCRAPVRACQACCRLPLARLQMRWFLDGQQYFATASADGARDGGWWSDGPGAGADSPFDRVGAEALPGSLTMRVLRDACAGRAGSQRAATCLAVATVCPVKETASQALPCTCQSQPSAAA